MSLDKPEIHSHSTPPDLFDLMKNPEYIDELKRKKEETGKLCDEIIAGVYGCDVSILTNNTNISCLRKNISLYEEYANSIKKDINLKKYFQKYNYKGKDYIVIPVINENTNKLHIKTYELINNDGILDISDNMQEAEGGYHNLIPVNFPDESLKSKYGTRYMNKWTGKIEDVNPYDYKMDDEGVKGLMSTIEENGNSKLEDCSKELQSSVSDILGKENELDKQGTGFEEQKIKIAQSVMKGDLSGAITGFIEIVKLFFTRKISGRVVGLGKNINYEGDERDVKYLESAISTVLDPEKRSELTYLISKIKDKHIKKILKENGNENPSQFDLLLQNCEPGQIMLTNALDLEGGSSSFKFATQVASGSRWCHALIISDVIRDNNGVVTDVKIIQSTLKGGVHETTLNKYISENYSSSDFLLANIPEDKREKLVESAKNKIGQKYDRVSIITDSILGMDFDNGESGDLRGNLLGKNKSYCSELVFDAMKEAGYSLPEPHISPSDLLLSEEVSPQYACYCDKF